MANEINLSLVSSIREKKKNTRGFVCLHLDPAAVLWEAVELEKKKVEPSRLIPERTDNNFINLATMRGFRCMKFHFPFFLWVPTGTWNTLGENYKLFDFKSP